MKLALHQLRIDKKRILTVLVIAASGLLMWLTLTPTVRSAASSTIPRWDSTRGLPQPLADVEAVVHGDRVYIVGGKTASGNPTSDVFMAQFTEDGGIGVWTRVQSLPVPLYSHAAVATYNFLYVIGGYDGSNSRKEVYGAKFQEDGTLGVWRKITEYPFPVVLHDAIGAGTSIYVVGGTEGISTTKKANIYVLDTDYYEGTSIGNWRALRNLPKALYRHAVVMYQERLYVFGGYDGSSVQNTIYYADMNYPDLGNWTTTQLPGGQGREYLSIVTNGGRLYVLGGRSSSGELNSVFSAQVYHHGGLTAWSSESTLPQSLYRFAAFSGQDRTLSGRIYVFGGLHGGDNGYQNAAYRATASRDAFTGCGSVVEIPQSECAALAAFYNATNGDSWSNRTGWWQTNVPHDWEGVAIWRGNVNGLFLPNHNLSGVIPAELAQLQNLQYVDFRSNNLGGSIPVALGSLLNLWSLRLNDNQLQGQIPDALGQLRGLGYFDLTFNQLSGPLPPSLGNLTDLYELSVAYNQLIGPIPSSLGNLTNVRSLNLDNNQFSGSIPEAFGNLQRVEWMSLAANDLSGDIPALLGNLGQLRELYLYGNRLEGAIPSSLGGLQNIRVLRLDGNNLTGTIPPSLGSLPNMIGLELSWNRLDGSIPSVLGGLSNLRWLRLEHNQLSGDVPSQLGNLANLEWLSLDNNELNGAIPSQLGNLSNLTGLSLGDNQLGGQIPPSLGNLSRLQSLHLYSNQLNGAIPPDLGRLTELRSLELGGNRLTGSLPSQLSNLSNLEVFWVWGNQLTGALPQWLGNMPSLQYMGLGNNSFSGTIPSTWQNLSDLRSLNLWGLGLQGQIPSWLGGFPQMRYLNLGNNQFSGEIPATLGNLSNLNYLYLHENQLTGAIPPQLGNVSNLYELSLYSNRLSGSIPPQLGNLLTLRRLNLSENQLNGVIPSQLGNPSGLRTLVLYNNQLSGSIPVSISALGSLVDFLVTGNQLEGSVPAALCPVTWYAYNRITGSGGCTSWWDTEYPNSGETQTVAPSQFDAIPFSTTEVLLTWQPIPYTSDGGYYELSYSTSPGGPFTVAGTTANKGINSHRVQGLRANTFYAFRIRAYTPAHDPLFQSNNLWSAYATVTEGTFATNPPPNWLSNSVYLPSLQKSGGAYGLAPSIIYWVDQNGCEGGYMLRWLPIAGATRYRVEETTGDLFAPVTTVYDGVNTFYTVQGRTPNRYAYRVMAMNDNSASSWSDLKWVDVCSTAGNAVQPEVQANDFGNSRAGANYGDNGSGQAELTGAKSYELSELKERVEDNRAHESRRVAEDTFKALELPDYYTLPSITPVCDMLAGRLTAADQLPLFLQPLQYYALCGETNYESR